MRVVIKMDFTDAEREVIAAEIDELHGKKVSGRKATRAEIRDFIQGGRELRLTDAWAEVEGWEDRQPEVFAKGYTLPDRD